MIILLTQNIRRTLWGLFMPVANYISVWGKERQLLSKTEYNSLHVLDEETREKKIKELGN